MIKTIAAAAICTPILLSFSTTVAYAQPAERGANGGAETQSTGTPLDAPVDGTNIANGFGSITSQRAVNDGDIGTHVSAQDTPHLGVGNVARNDAAEFDAASQLCNCDVIDNGTRPGNHAVAVGPLVGYDPHTRPGTRESE